MVKGDDGLRSAPGLEPNQQEEAQGKEARELFLEFIYDHHSELEKWQQFYQERSRVRIIEWLRNEAFHFVFEEDLDLNVGTIENVKPGETVPGDVFTTTDGPAEGVTCDVVHLERTTSE